MKSALCVKLRISLCVLCVFVSFSFPPCRLSSLSLWALKCPLVSANHFWSIFEIYSQFFPITPASFQSLHHPTLYSPTVGSWIVGFSQEDTDESLTLWQFHAVLVNLVIFFFYFYILQMISVPSCHSLLYFHTPSSSLPISLFLCSFSFFSWQADTNRCGSLCGTNRPEAEGCLCPFSLITSHLCVHKQTNTAINLRARCRLRGRGHGRGGENQNEGDRRRQSFVSFTLVHEAGHAICHVLSLLHH